LKEANIRAQKAKKEEEEKTKTWTSRIVNSKNSKRITKLLAQTERRE